MKINNEIENNFTEVCFITAPKMSAIGLNWLCPKYFPGFLFANRNPKIKSAQSC